MNRKLHILKNRILMAALLALLAFAPGIKGWGQIAAWDFFGVGSSSLPTFAATTFNANLVSTSNASNITRGPNAAWSAGANSFRTVGFKNEGISTSNLDYFQITLTASTGYTLSLSTIDAKFAGTASFCANPGVTCQFAYSLNGTSFTLIGSPQINIGSPATLVQVNLGGVAALQNVAAGTTVTIRYYASGQTTTGGWGFNSPTAVDNGLAIGGTVSPSGGALTPPVLTAASGATVDNPFNVTFTDDPSWRAAITAVTVNGSTLAPAAYATGIPGMITFTPSLSILLQSAGTKSLVIIATGYTNDVISQPIAAGVPNKLGMTTQPTAPATNGGVLAIQPVVAIQDQYGNLTTGTDNVTAAVGAGTWTLGGTTIVAALSGSAAFSGLTASSATSVTGATISFNSGTLTGITSAGFNIPSPSLPEPTNHAANFSAAAPNSSNITVTWLDNDGAQPATGFLILGNKTGTFTDPVDGTDPADDANLADGTGVMHVLHGVQTYTWTALDASTPYYFAIYPYSNSGAAIDYKTLPAAPTSNATTPAPTITTYTWNAASGSWNTAANWTPARTTPSTSDVLVFDGTIQATPSVTLDFTSPQTIGKLQLLNNAVVAFSTSAAARTLNIGTAGSTAPQLDIAAGSSLAVSAASVVTLNVPTGYTGSISGNITFQNAAHRLTATDASGITFNSGAVFIAGTGFSGNAFGTANLLSVVFASGSTYLAQAGANPFGASSPNSVLTFQTGSLYKLVANISPGLSGRTYANFELDYTGTAITVTGSGASSINDLVITNGVLNYNMTGTPGHSIKGNISVASGATLNFAPATAGTVNLNGPAIQTISGTGIIGSAALSTLVVNNALGVVLDANATLLGNLTITSGSITINPVRQLTVGGSLVNTPGNNGLVINSSASGTGSLISSTAGVSGTVKRFISAWGDVTQGWHLLSSPIASQAIQPEFVPGTTPIGSTQDFYAWDEVNGYWFNSKDVSGNWVPTFDAGFVTGKGYLVAYQSDVIKNFTGTLNVSSVSISGLTSTPAAYPPGDITPGWNLLGNPFTSALTWGTANWALTSVTATAKIWKESTAAYVDIAALTGIIPAMNGFMVETTGGGSLTIPAADRVHNAAPWYKSTANPCIKLVATNLGTQTAQESIVTFDSQAPPGFSPNFDSHFLPGYAPSFYSLDGTEKLSTNVLPSMDDQTTIPFNFVKTDGTDYSIEAVQLDNIPAQVYLTDLKINQTQNLMENPVYTFTSSDGDDPARFLLSFSHVGIRENATHVSEIYTYENNLYLINPGKARMEVYNLTGQQLLTEEIDSPGLFHTALHFPTGYYVVRLTTGAKVAVTKVFIKS